MRIFAHIIYSDNSTTLFTGSMTQLVSTNCFTVLTSDFAKSRLLSVYNQGD